MKTPLCRIRCVGDFSSWGRSFLKQLEEAVIAEPAFETLEQFSSSLTASHEPPIVVVENQPNGKGQILRLRESGVLFYIVWIGRSFTKEDLAFAVESRVFCTLENPKPEDRKVAEWFEKARRAQEKFAQFERLTYSIKSMLLQSKDEVPDQSLLTELRTAVGKLEADRLNDDFLGAKVAEGLQADSGVSFYKSQMFSDALTTIQDLERTGELRVRGPLPQEEGRVQFLQGKIVGAEAGGVHGLKALYRIFLWDEPRFLFSRGNPQDFKVDEQMTLSLSHICTQGEAMKRRFDKVRRQVPPGGIYLNVEPSALHTGTKLSIEEFSTLASVIEFREVGQILDFNSLPDVVVLESLIQLRKSNLLVVS